jgi:hypothetical protein
MTCFGLELDYTAEELGTPLEIILIAKVMDQGEFGYRLVTTSDLHTIEAMGMVRWGQLLLEEGVLNRCAAEEPVVAEEGEEDAPQ